MDTAIQLQIKQIQFEISRMPKKMDLNGVLDVKQMYDDLIPDYQPKSIDEIRREKTISQRETRDFSRNELDDRRKQMMEPRGRDIENDPRRNQKYSWHFLYL